MKKILFLFSFLLVFVASKAQTGGVNGITLNQALRSATATQTGGTLPVLRLVPVTTSATKYTFKSGQYLTNDALMYGYFRKLTDGSIAIGVDASLLGTGGSGTFNALSGDVVSTSTGSTSTIQNGVVSNTKMATMPSMTFKGNATGATATAQDLTTAQAKTALAIKDTDVTSSAALVIGSTTYPINSTQFTINTALAATATPLVYYASDALASAGGIPLNGEYLLDTANPYGLPKGSRKARQ